MQTIISGNRVGNFIVFVDQDGCRHAVRLGAVMALSDGDEIQQTTIMQLPGGRTVLIHASLDDVIAWFS